MTDNSANSSIPALQGPAADAVAYRGSHMQIIASAGSGKTETISQRIAQLVAEGVDPSKIVAFTFTERAAAELKERIRLRVEQFAGQASADKLGTMYVGTIHGFSFQMLTRYVTKYESYDVMDENQLAAFLQRQANFLRLKDLSASGSVFDGIKRFRQNLDVVENELLPLEVLPEDFCVAVESFLAMLEEFRALTFGQQIARAVEALCDPQIREIVCADIEYLVVDEYQDVNPAQEELIRRLAKPMGLANLVVVGDDDQAIYQWRGSRVANIVTFTERYPDVATFELLRNWRSRPAIVKLADRFAQSIPGRLPKTMLPVHPSNGPAVDIVLDYDNEEQEAAETARSIQKLRSMGFHFADMAVLVRTKTAYPRLMAAFETHGVPVQPGGRVGLFEQPDAHFLGRCIAWLADYEWRSGQYSRESEVVTLDSLLRAARTLYAADGAMGNRLQAALESAKAMVGTDSRRVSLVDIVYTLTEALAVRDWDIEDPLRQARLGTIARFCAFVADYEAVQKRARVPADGDATQAGASDQKEWYFKNLAGLMLNVAMGNYTDFEGEEDLLSDAVAMMTVHAAKGLEWPIVFMPSLTQQRFPNERKQGEKTDWIVPRDLFDAARYEGTDADERRLFYVAATRAREWLAMSAHAKVTTRAVAPSTYAVEVKTAYDEEMAYPPAWHGPEVEADAPILHVTYSDVAAYLDCGYAYWLKSRIGFPAAIVQEIGYGKAVHHLLRVIAEESTRLKRSLGPVDVDRILAQEFFLPFAGKAVADRMKTSARNLVFKYLKDYNDDMTRVWQTERPFELALDGVVVSGRADVILDKHDGRPDSLAIVDYKTQVGGEDPGLQLQVYTEAGLREGLDVRAAYLHDLGTEERRTVAITAEARAAAVATVEAAARGIKDRNFDAKPEKSRCGRCDVRAMCRKAAK